MSEKHPREGDLVRFPGRKRGIVIRDPSHRGMSRAELKKLGAKEDHSKLNAWIKKHDEQVAAQRRDANKLTTWLNKHDKNVAMNNKKKSAKKVESIVDNLLSREPEGMPEETASRAFLGLMAKYGDRQPSDVTDYTVIEQLAEQACRLVGMESGEYSMDGEGMISWADGSSLVYYDEKLRWVQPAEHPMGDDSEL